MGTTHRSRERIAIDKTIGDVHVLVMKGNFHSAAKRMGALRRRLEEHLEVEARLVPLYVARTGDPLGLALRLRHEHEAIPECLEATCAALTHWEGPHALHELSRLADAISHHLVTERQLLHPALDDLVAEDVDWAALRYTLCEGSNTLKNARLER